MITTTSSSLKGYSHKNRARFSGLREYILERDGYACVRCGMTQEQHIGKWGKSITINHIDGKGRNARYPNNDPNNLETLCLRCHGAVDGVRAIYTPGGHPGGLKTINDIFTKCDEVGDCIVWRGSVEKHGFGECQLNGKKRYVHRHVYVALIEDLLPNDKIGHSCSNKLCVNPTHLYKMSQLDFLMYSNSPIALNYRKTKCKRGHPFTPENTSRSYRGTRRCKTCKRADNTRRRYGKRA